LVFHVVFLYQMLVIREILYAHPVYFITPMWPLPLRFQILLIKFCRHFISPPNITRVAPWHSKFERIIIFGKVYNFNSSVTIVTCYGQGGPGIESRCGRNFPHPSRPFLGEPPSLLYIGYRVFPAKKRPGHGTGHPSHPTPRLEKSWAIHLPPSGPTWSAVGRNWPLLRKIWMC